MIWPAALSRAEQKLTAAAEQRISSRANDKPGFARSMCESVCGDFAGASGCRLICRIWTQWVMCGEAGRTSAGYQATKQAEME